MNQDYIKIPIHFKIPGVFAVQLLALSAYIYYLYRRDFVFSFDKALFIAFMNIFILFLVTIYGILIHPTHLILTKNQMEIIYHNKKNNIVIKNIIEIKKDNSNFIEEFFGNYSARIFVRYYDDYEKYKIFGSPSNKNLRLLIEWFNNNYEKFVIDDEKNNSN